jgi:hypothetical protein
MKLKISSHIKLLSMSTLSLITKVAKKRTIETIPEKIRKYTPLMKKSGCLGTLFSICLRIDPFRVVNPVLKTIAKVF